MHLNLNKINVTQRYMVIVRNLNKKQDSETKLNEIAHSVILLNL